jgi:hypothetical protein
VRVEADIFSALGPLVGNRVYPLSFIQPNGSLPVWPSIRYSIIGEVPSIMLCGDTGDEASDIRFQLDVVDKGYTLMRSLRLQVISTIHVAMPLAILQLSIDDFDEQTSTYRAILDYTLFKSTSADSPP